MKHSRRKYTINKECREVEYFLLNLKMIWAVLKHGNHFVSCVGSFLGLYDFYCRREIQQIWLGKKSKPSPFNLADSLLGAAQSVAIKADPAEQ